MRETAWIDREASREERRAKKNEALAPRPAPFRTMMSSYSVIFCLMAKGRLLPESCSAIRTSSMNVSTRLVIVSLLTDGRFIQSSISERGKPLWAAGRDANMKRRGLASPDDGDALALTFADRPGRSTILNMIPSGPGLRWQLTPAPPLRS